MSKTSSRRLTLVELFDRDYDYWYPFLLLYPSFGWSPSTSLVMHNAEQTYKPLLQHLNYADDEGSYPTAAGGFDCIG